MKGADLPISGGLAFAVAPRQHVWSIPAVATRRRVTLDDVGLRRWQPIWYPYGAVRRDRAGPDRPNRCAHPHSAAVPARSTPFALPAGMTVIPHTGPDRSCARLPA